MTDLARNPRRIIAGLGTPLLFLLLSALFLWQPLLSRNVFLPTDLSYRYDYMWKGHENDPGLVVAQNPTLSDVADYYYPYADFAIKRLRSGHFPLWNPYILTGTPFFSSAQAAVLDPINLLTYTAGPMSYWTWAAWLRMALLGFTTCGFIRALGRGRAGGLAGGVVFMACGFVAVWLNYSVVTSLTWMPSLFWAGTRAMQTGRAVWMAATAMALGLVFTGGHPETEFLAVLAWGIYTFYCIIASPWSLLLAVSRTRRILLTGGSALLGLLLSAVQTVPFVNFLLTSSAFQSRAMNVQPAALSETLLRFGVLLWPNISGTPVEHNYWAGDITNFNEQTGYYGLLALALGAVGTIYWFRRDRVVRFLAAATILSVLLAIQAPGFYLIKTLPIFNVGHGVRWAILISFFGAVLAGYGVDALAQMRARSSIMRRAALGLLAGGICAGAVPLALYWGLKAGNWPIEQWAGQHAISHAAMVRLFQPAHLTLYWPALLLLLGAVVALLRWRGYLAARGTAALLVLLLFSDLTLFGSTYNPVTPADEIYPPNQITAYLGARLGHGRFIGSASLLRPDVNMTFGFRDVRGYEDLIDQTFANFYDRFYRESSPVLDPANMNMQKSDQRQLQIAGVRYIASTSKPRVEGSAKPFTTLLEQQRIALYEDPSALPRAYVAFGSTVRPDADSAATAVRSASTDPRTTVVLAQGTPIQAPTGLDYTAAPVTWLQDEPDDVVVEATLPRRGYLVLSDNYAPGWEAEVDKAPATITRANQVFRAVALTAGKHTVEFHYRPPLVYAGAVLSGIALIAIVGIALFHLWRARRMRLLESPIEN